MIYALAADVHGNIRNLEAILPAARELGAEAVIIAGDYLECRIGKSAMASARVRALADVVDEQPQLWELLAGCVLVRGNQEERIAALTAALPLEPLLARLLDAPPTVLVSSLRVLHGHTFDWSKCDGWWVPTLDEAIPSDRLIAYGHSHQELVVRLPGTGERQYVPVPVRMGVPVRLAGPGRFLINLAPLRERPVWLLYDDVAEVAVFHRVAPRTEPATG
jgi:predicted phosphodiesterase